MLKRPVFLATCMYGITFIILENTASNSVSFATNILDAAHVKEAPGKIIVIAIAANTLCCLLHALSRKWGILLNNFFGTLKLFILLFVIIIGLICRFFMHRNKRLVYKHLLWWFHRDQPRCGKRKLRSEDLFQFRQQSSITISLC